VEIQPKTDKSFILSPAWKGQGETRLPGDPLEQRAPGFPVSLSPDLQQAMIDNHGNPRLAKARDYFLPLDAEKLDELLLVFDFWQNFDEYALLKGTNSRTGETKFVGVKAAKRGNDVYARRLDEKLGFLNRLKKTQLFNISDFKVGHQVRTQLLWVTWTWDVKICSLDESWRRAYEDLHRWKANIENHYGKIEWLVFPQAFPDRNGSAFGYLHIHGVILMNQAQFSVFPSMESDHEGHEILRYRIHEKKEFADQGKWHSFIDVQALSSVQAAANYCRKYAQKVCYGDTEKAMINSAIAWIYRKKGFTTTHGFREKLNDLIELLQDRKTSFQVDLHGKRVEEWSWECLGVFAGSDLHVNYGEWTIPIGPGLAHDLLRQRKGQVFRDAWDESGSGLQSGGGGSCD
jgi:hypothetical protein